MTEHQYIAVDSIIDSKTITFTGDIINLTLENSCFVYGQYVSDFNVIKMDYIFSLTTSCVKFLETKVTTLEAQVAALESQMASALARLDAL